MGVPLTTGLVGVFALPPPHPVVAAIAASNRSEVTNAGFTDFFAKPTKRCLVSGNLALLRKSQISIETTGKNQSAGGAIRPTGRDDRAAFAVVDTVTGTLTEEPAVTVRGEAGPLQVACAGAPVQATLTLNGPPVAASCSAKDAD